MLFLAAILLAALALRVYGLGSESIWLDEATSIVQARMDIPHLVQSTAVDIHPPLYYVILHFWLVIGDGALQVRLLSVMVGVASVAVLYLLARRLFGRQVAIAASMLLAFSPLHVWYSQETRMYTMLALFALVTSYCMVRALLDGKRWAWIAYVLFSICSLYTHYYAFFVLLFQDCFVLYLAWRGHIQRRMFRPWVVAQVVTALAFTPWLPVLLNQVRSGGGAWVERAGVPGVQALVTTATTFTLGPDARWYPSALRRLAYAVFGLLFVIGSVSALSRPRKTMGVVFSLMYLVLPLGAAWMISQVKPLYNLRYLLPFLPAYYILIGQGLETLLGSTLAVGRAMRGWLWALAPAGLAVIGLVGIVGSATHEQQPDWRGIASYVVDEAQADDIVIFVPGWNDKPFDYYTHSRVALLGTGKVPLPITEQNVVELVDAARQGRQRVWLVQTDGHYADPQYLLRTYLDNTFTRLDRRPFRDNITVSLYRIAP